METGGKESKVINHVRYIDGDQNQQPRRPDYNAPRSRNEIIYERQAGGALFPKPDRRKESSLS
ncbi:hypothetical protein T02_7848 [Trichinella nativa]|uniref:Uncharacterized protein n=1 Tax=Trichinella nativa TaxID=6335 RepID=A0A0V1LB92_9BILA|nr:hypothetical protein T02_7848 [Trichinella nativa]